MRLLDRLALWLDRRRVRRHRRAMHAAKVSYTWPRSDYRDWSAAFMNEFRESTRR